LVADRSQRRHVPCRPKRTPWCCDHGCG